MIKSDPELLPVSNFDHCIRRHDHKTCIDCDFVSRCNENQSDFKETKSKTHNIAVVLRIPYLRSAIDAHLWLAKFHIVCTMNLEPLRPYWVNCVWDLGSSNAWLLGKLKLRSAGRWEVVSLGAPDTSVVPLSCGDPIRAQMGRLSVLRGVMLSGRSNKPLRVTSALKSWCKKLFT